MGIMYILSLLLSILMNRWFYFEIIRLFELSGTVNAWRWSNTLHTWPVTTDRDILV